MTSLLSYDKSSNKRQKLALSKDDSDGRSKYLKQLRAICDCASTASLTAFELKQIKNADRHGLELLRLFLIDLFDPTIVPPLSKVICRRELDCRHNAKSCLPPGKLNCWTAGTSDAKKANSFRKDSIKNTLRMWLKNRATSELVLSDSDSSSGIDSRLTEDECYPISRSSSIKILSSFDPADFPSSLPRDRISTKQRVHLLSYMRKYSIDIDDFYKTFKCLIRNQPKQEIAHLCGCGLSNETVADTCVEPSHLTLCTHDSNLQHIPYHTMAKAIGCGEEYLAYYNLFANKECYKNLF